MTNPCKVRVAVADPHATLAESLGIAFGVRHYRYDVVPLPRGGAARTDRVLSQLLALRPDVVLVNADLGPHCNGIALIAPLVRAGVAVVVLTDAADEARWGECLAQGARTVLSMNASLAEVISTVRRAAHGEALLERAERARLVAVHREQRSDIAAGRARLDRLTPQEGEILRHLMVGRSVTEISKERVVAEATVRSQVKSILTKLEVSSQLAAVAVAHLAGWSDHAHLSIAS